MNNHAVSPVIGVILMVAITVILAGVISAFVFGMAGTTHNNLKMISVTAEQADENTIAVMYRGGIVSDFVSATVNITDDNGDYLEVDNISNVVGTCVIGKGKLSEKNHVVVVASYSDGSRQVVFDSYV